MLARGLGHIPDHEENVEEDLRDRHVGALLGGAVGDLPTIIDYSRLLDRIPDQGGTNSCVGQAFATAIFLRALIQGISIPRPAPKAIYDIGRLIDAPKQPLEDFGTRPRAATDGITEYGLVAEARWPLTDGNVNELPPLDVFEASLGALLSNHYRIGGADIPPLIRSALERGFIPVFAMDVDDAYMNYGGGTYGGLTSTRRGSHMQAIVGCGTDCLLVANSWGTGWGLGGFAKIAPAFFNTSAVRDVIVPTIVPKSLS